MDKLNTESRYALKWNKENVKKSHIVVKGMGGLLI